MMIVKCDMKNLSTKGILLRVPKTVSLNPDSQTFYLSSETTPGKEYIIQTRAKRGAYKAPMYAYAYKPAFEVVNELDYICSCPDFTIRRWGLHEDCKHIETLKFLASRVGGVKALAEMVRTAG